MSANRSRVNMKARLKEIRHKPIRNGGNGRPLPLPQLALLHVLGEGWEAEVAVPTRMRHLNLGYPTNYKIDIANRERKIGIELDGSSHCSLVRQEQDRKKMGFLTSQGWSIYRVSNNQALYLYTTFKSVDTLLFTLEESLYTTAIW